MSLLGLSVTALFLDLKWISALSGDSGYATFIGSFGGSLGKIGLSRSDGSVDAGFADSVIGNASVNSPGPREKCPRPGLLGGEGLDRSDEKCTSSLTYVGDP